jgi:hypothetical protein
MIGRDSRELSPSAPFSQAALNLARSRPMTRLMSSARASATPAAPARGSLAAVAG